MNPTAVSPGPRPGIDLHSDRQSQARLRPRFEGSNVGTWIGFKHVNYLVEEAVLEHLRSGGLAAGDLYETYGLCVDLVDIDCRILTAFRIDDVAVAQVRPLPEPGLAFAVDLHVDGASPVKAVTATARVQLRWDLRGGGEQLAPAGLEPYPVSRLGVDPGPEAGVDAPAAGPVPAGDLTAQLVAGRNAFAWKRRIPYFYCHYTERMQVSGYLRQMEEVVDLFLADRGVSVKRLLDEQAWIPAVPHSRITLLDEARMEEELYTVLTVENVFKRLTFTSRMDCYVVRDQALVPTATGRITHGYAVIENRRDWRLVSFDDRLHAALAQAPAAGGSLR